MSPRFHLRGAFAALLIALTAGPAAAAEVSDVSFGLDVVAADGAPVSTVVSGAAWYYDVNYAITGADLAGVGATITVDLPEGLWVTGSTAATGFDVSCLQAGTNAWKFSCTFAAADLDINTAGGVAGQGRILVRSRRFYLGHGDTVTATGSLVVTWPDAVGTLQTRSDAGAHTMGFTASPGITVSTVATGTPTALRSMMAGPNGEAGVLLGYDIRINNAGTALLTDVELTATIPEGFLLEYHNATSQGWGVVDKPLWQGGTYTFTRPSWGLSTKVSSTGNVVAAPAAQVAISLGMWVPCNVLATLRNADGSVPDAVRQVVGASATGYGLYPNDETGTVGTHVVADVGEANNSANPINLTGITCGTGQADFTKVPGAPPAAGGTLSFPIRATLEYASTYEQDAVIWDALDPSLERFHSAYIGAPNDGTFTTYYCDLSDLTVEPAHARTDFLWSWKDDRCTDIAPGSSDAPEWSAISHIFFHAPSWGDPNPELGYRPTNFYASVTTYTKTDALHGDVVSNTAWYESDNVTLAERTASTAVTDIAVPRLDNINSGGGKISFPSTSEPGDAIAIDARLYGATSPLPLNPSSRITLPPGVLYQGSTVTFGPSCVTAEASGEWPPGTWIPIDYSAQPTAVPLPDGSLELTWTWGSAANPFRLNRGCGVGGYQAILIHIDGRIDSNRSYTWGQKLPVLFEATADNAASAWNWDVTRNFTVIVPAEMRVEVVPWCEELGRIGFNSIYENSGGVELTNVIVTFPIPETLDPSGAAALDTTYFAAASSDDPDATIEYQVGGAWTPTPPTDLTIVTAVRLLVPSLPANSGSRPFYVDLVIADGNTGDSRIHATSSMKSDQLREASSPVSIPFVLNTCPKPLTVSKFFDRDSDGVWSDGEPTLKGWRFEVYDTATGALVDARSTDLDGDAQFTLVQGSYTVTEVIPAATDPDLSWSATTQAGLSQAIGIGFDSDYALVFGNVCSCDDGDLCTDDVCDPVQGCLHSPVVCDDGNVCTINTCSPSDGACVTTQTASTIRCDDGDPCTDADTCDGAGSCVGVQTCNEAPVAQCADVTVLAGAACGAEASVDAGSYDADGDALTLIQDPAAVYQLGATSVTLTVTDGALSDNCVATVTVVDETAPAVALIGDGPVTTECSATYTDAGATASDGCDGDLTASLAWTTDLDVSLPGSYGFTWAVSDATGNQGTATRTVNVVDSTPPDISCGTIGCTATANTITFGEPGALHGALVGATYAAAPTFATFTNARFIDVANNPVGGVPWPIGGWLGGDFFMDMTGGVPVSETNATRIDFAADVANVSIRALDVGYAGAAVKVLDADGNVLGFDQRSGSGAGNNTYFDFTFPVAGVRTIKLYQSNLQNLGDGAFWQGLKYEICQGGAAQTIECTGALTPCGTTATASDLCSPVTLSSHASGDACPLGDTTTAHTATDAAGNTSTCSATVTVVDTTAPVLTVLGDAPAIAECGGTYADAGAIATDTCAGSAGGCADGAGGWAQVSPGVVHTCAIKSDGRLFCWGNAGNGALGNGVSLGKFSVPVQEVSQANDWTQVASGSANACAIKTDGRLFCWGAHARGRVDGTLEESLVPLQEVSGATDWAQVAKGQGGHTCAVKTDGRLFCWGDGSRGQLGNGSAAESWVPVPESTEGVDWAQVAVGGLHTCAVKTDGRLFCWGYGGLGALGDGSGADSLVPAPVSADADWAQVSAGWVHTCAVKTDGRLFCWGAGDSGQRGDGSTAQSNVPVQESSQGADWARVSGGLLYHTCAVKTDGRLFCWGRNDTGQLGNGDDSSAHHLVPVQEASQDADWAQVEGGKGHTCGVKGDGRLFCWGDNVEKQLGDDSNTLKSLVPVHVAAQAATCESAGDLTAAIATTSAVDTTSVGTYGVDYQVSDPSGNASAASRQVLVADTVAPELTLQGAASETLECTLGQTYTDPGASASDVCDGALAVVTAGTVDPEQVGTYVIDYSVADAAGNSSETARTVEVIDTTAPVLTVLGDAPAVAECGGTYTDAGATATDTCAGSAGGCTDDSGGWAQVSAGRNHTCAIKTDGRLFCWGSAGNGGPGTTPGSGVPVQEFSQAADWVQVAAGQQNTCAIKSDGRLFCWGDNTYGQLASGSNNELIPVPLQEVSGATDWAQVAMGWYHTCAVKTDGRLFCWGNGSQGRLGNGDTASSFVPVQESSEAVDWTQVSAGGVHTCAVKTDGRLFCWGFGSTGALGNGLFQTQLVAALVPEDADWAYVSAGGTHTCAVKTDGRLFCWGSGDSGQLGDGDTATSFVPVQESSQSADWARVSGGSYHTCAVKTNGRTFCWGSNSFGQLGNGDDSSAPQNPDPVQELSRGADWAQVEAGQGHTCAVKTDGRLFCWGDNAGQQLGDDSTEDSPVPVQEASQAVTCESAGDLTTAITTTSTVDTTAVGSYGVDYQVSDPSGNASNANRQVVVADSAPPTLTVLGDAPAVAECGGTYSDAGATATDVCAGDLTAAITATSTVDTAAVGSYGVDYQVADPANNAATATRQVNVTDTVAPELTLQGAASLTLECGLEQTYSDPGASAADICDGALTVAATGSVDPATVGAYVLDYAATDGSGNASDAARTVEVVDTTPPIAGDDAAETREGVPVTVAVLANDADADDFTDQYRVGATSAPAGGSVSVNANNTVTYTPNPGHHGPDSFTYEVIDGGCGSAWGNVSVNTMCDVRVDVPPRVALGGSNQTIVWIYGTASIDVTQVDTATLELNGVAVQVRVVGKGKELVSYDDRDGDGFLDAKYILDTAGLIVSSGDATLTGWLLDGSCKLRDSTETLDVVGGGRFPLYVVERGTGKLSRIDADLSLTTIYSGLSDPLAVVFLPNGNLLVSERGRSALTELTTAGAFVSRITPGFSPNDMLVDPDGTVYVGSFSGGLYRRLPGDAEFTHFAAVSGDMTGLRRVGDWIYQLNAAGTLYRVDVATGAVSVVLTGLNRFGVEILGGDLLVSGGRIQRITGLGAGETPSVSFYSEGSADHFCDRGDPGSPTLSVQASPGSIVRLDEAGTMSTVLGPTSALSRSRGCTFSP